ncbi:hypothetical protein HDF09_004055 [Edaphobacter lichenicola]|uniref:Uncharacterized protein n=1 Tax=Tunturiibacter empetritectus TaxID=3069691 RepID=A0A7W8MUJ0_9BACT|nr:hypothetical protein [Edaphobacter lichenicola]
MEAISPWWLCLYLIVYSLYLLQANFVVMRKAFVLNRGR